MPLYRPQQAASHPLVSGGGTVEQHYPARVFTLHPRSSPATAAATVGFMPEQLSCAAVLNERGHNSGAVRKVLSNKCCLEE